MYLFDIYCIRKQGYIQISILFDALNIHLTYLLSEILFLSSATQVREYTLYFTISNQMNICELYSTHAYEYVKYIYIRSGRQSVETENSLANINAYRQTYLRAKITKRGRHTHTHIETFSFK